MDTNDLISILSQSPQPKKPVSFGLVTTLLLTAILAFTIFVLGVRPDLNLSSVHTTAIHKTLLLGIVAVSIALFLSEVSKPIPRTDRVKPYIWFSIIMFVGSIGYEVVTTPLSQIAEYFTIINFPECLFFVTLYGVLGSLVFFWLMKFYAPKDAKLAGIGIGMAASAVGALGYSLHCPLDSPVFIAVAYGLPTIAMGFVGKFIISRYIEW
jgi:hypothetical protein